jgi:hypothetical protein
MPFAKDLRKLRSLPRLFSIKTEICFTYMVHLSAVKCFIKLPLVSTRLLFSLLKILAQPA